MNQQATSQTSPAAPGRYLSVEEAAEYTGLSKSYLDKLRVRGGGCPHSKIGTRILYGQSDIDAWIRSRRRATTAEPVAA